MAKPLYYIGQIQDINEHKKFQEMLKESEERFRTSFENANIGVCYEWVGVMTDITESKKSEEQIKASLHEKEILLREIHHRVKNNMQVITSLLNLQSIRIKDDEARKQFVDSENRIRSMALVHEMLYQSKDLANIDFRKYVNDLTKNMCNSLSLSKNKIPIEVNIQEQYLDATRSIPCGQIITELISNSLKHAFPVNKNGQISIGFKGDEKGNYSLTISDNGIGLPKDFDMSKTETLGLKLLNAYVKQLKGEMKVSGENGTEVSIIFPGE